MAKVEPINEKTFQFPEEGHDRLIQTALATVVIRKAAGLKPLQEQPRRKAPCVCEEEAKLDTTAVLRRRLRDYYPELSDKPYNDKLDELFEKRRRLFSSKHVEEEQTDPSVIQINTQFLSRELELTEIGFIPETD